MSEEHALNADVPEADATAAAAMPSTVAVDDGYAYTKVAWRDEGGSLRTHVIPSRAKPGLHISTNLEGDSDGGYVTEGLKFSVGNFPDPADTRDNQYPFSPLNRVIVHHALRDAGFAAAGDHTIESLGLTVPFQRYYEGRDRITDRRAASFAQTVASAVGSRPALTVREEGVRVFPESAVAWVDHVLDERGQDAADPAEPLAIIDVGGRTTDIAVMPSGNGAIDQALSGTDHIGVMATLEDIKRQMHRRFEVDVPDRVAEEALHTGRVLLYGQREDISELVEDAKAQVAAQIHQAVSRRVSEGAFLSRLIFIGGGSSVMREALTTYPHVEVPQKPEFANVRGVLKYQLYRE